MKILIVDDNKENLYFLQTLLSGNGFKVVSASNGKEALEKLRSDKFDLIISDILMPVMDGFRLCRECNADAELKSIPFVFYTATYTEAKDEELALKMGAERFIRKPADPEEFIKIIRLVIAESEEGKIIHAEPSEEAEEVTFKLYNERLVRKLEKKMLELEASEKKYHRICENINDLVFMLDTEGRFTLANCKTEMLGYTMEDIIGKPFFEFLPYYIVIIFPVAPVVRRCTGDFSFHRSSRHGVIDDRPLNRSFLHFFDIFPSQRFILIFISDSRETHPGKSFGYGKYDTPVSVIPCIRFVLPHHRELHPVNGFKLIEGEPQRHGGKNIDFHQNMPPGIVGS